MSNPSASCTWCRRTNVTTELRPLPTGFRLIAGLSLGPVHAGMWIWEVLSQNYCSRCRLRISLLILVFAGVVVAIIVAVLRWAVHSGLLPRGLIHF